jgi:ABC-type multidrug transport system ATPase subunit
MAIREFKVGPLRGLERAEASNLGNLVVLAGPNGAGKSTLLHLLRQERQQWAEPGTTVMFVGPHRTWRSSSLNKVALYGFPMSSYGELLQSDNLPNFQYAVPQGMHGLQGAYRDTNGAEDAPAFVKTTLGRLNDKQQSLIAKAWQSNGGAVPEGAVPDLFLPFERLVRTLLPHLEWAGIDDVDPNNIQVRFRPAGRPDVFIDIDHLSSGEKAAIALLLPLVERQSEQMVSGFNSPDDVVPLTMLLDEPEIHLHPLLQLQVLQYLRALASEGAAQFILSTHSPTLLDALADDELYLVSPASLSPENQLSRLTSSQERLEVAREITGSTHLLTRAKPIVFLEGEEERNGLASDGRLVASLLPQTKSWALVPGRSKREVIDAVSKLRQGELDLPGTPVFGLVDADSDGAPAIDYVVAWPVTMVENFLLDPAAIHDVLAPFGAQTRATSPRVVRDALEAAAKRRVADEVRLRVQRQLPIGRLTLKPDELDRAQDVATDASKKWLDRLQALDVHSVAAAARAEVDVIAANDQMLERFHGKKILQSIYQDLRVADAGLSRSAFSLMLADHEASRQRAGLLANDALARIRLFMPLGLPAALLRGGNQDIGEELAGRCQSHYEAWAAGMPTSEGRLRLREEIFAFARETGEEQHHRLVSLAAQIGTE